MIQKNKNFNIEYNKFNKLFKNKIFYIIKFKKINKIKNINIINRVRKLKINLLKNFFNKNSKIDYFEIKIKIKINKKIYSLL